MRWTRGTRFGAWALAAVVVGAVSFFVGSALKPEAAPHYVFETEAPAHDAPSAIAATSPGGFTGFGEVGGGRSRVVIAGRVVEKSGDSVVIESVYGQRTPVRFGESPRILRLEGADASLLRAGLQATLRLNEAGDTVEAVLVAL